MFRISLRCDPLGDCSSEMGRKIRRKAKIHGFLLFGNVGDWLCDCYGGRRDSSIDFGLYHGAQSAFVCLAVSMHKSIKSI